MLWHFRTAHRLDRVSQRVVLMAEFCRFGNRNQKIARLHITHSMYNGLLDAAMDIIQEELNNG